MEVYRLHKWYAMLDRVRMSSDELLQGSAVYREIYGSQLDAGGADD